MQDFHSIPGLAGRIFSSGSGSGGGGGADHRRMRGYPGGGGHEPPAKCPRCDSVNTKFCYYNNYNLSQPRHFCKSCRRYWTKGGVLRNVPVGGGCRKSSSKRSSSSSSSAKKPSSAGKDRRRPPASRSSSDSSSLTAATTDPSAPFTSPDLFAPRASNPNTNPDFDPTGADPVAPDPDIFPEAGSFTSLMASAASVPSILGLSFSNPPPLRLPAQQPYQRAGGVAAEEEIRMPGLTAGFIDQTVPLDAPVRMNGGGIIGLDWPGSVDPGLFDLTSAVDPGTYWNLGHWGDTDPSSLYLP